jgi:sulfate adenylyltransferase large subunit
MAIVDEPATMPDQPVIFPSQDDANARVDALLEAERGKDLLRFSTAGSVDDGKSTLIGRLLYDSRNVYDDHVQSITRDSIIDFAQLTDGLRAEREQGITIDVAYRYFSTATRKFIIADTPGHEQYTRNMATGASTADVAIVLVDARKGILDQTRRHTCIAALLGIPIVIAAINKMDLIGFSQAIFEEHRRSLLELARRLDIPELIAVPVSALDGDNVVHRSARTPWYRSGDDEPGPSLLEVLETVPLAVARSQVGFRLPVQRVIRPHQDFRGFAGQIAAGSVRAGDEVVALPSRVRTRVSSITVWEGELEEANAPQSVVLTLDNETDISRGDMIVSAATPPQLTSRFLATVVWMNARPLQAGNTYLLKHTTQTVRARVLEIRSRIDVENLEPVPAESLALNFIGEVVIETSRPLLADLYRENRTTGSFILIDVVDHATAGAGMIRSFEDLSHPAAEGRLVYGALVTVGDRRELAIELEDQLLEIGATVVRTRVADNDVLLPLVRAGAIVIVESSHPEHVTVAGTHGEPFPARSAESAEAILAQLRSASPIAAEERRIP